MESQSPWQVRAITLALTPNDEPDQQVGMEDEAMWF